VLVFAGIFDKPTEYFKSEYLKASINSKGSQRVPLTVVLDNVRDPGNLGSIIRTAAGIGCDVILSKGKDFFHAHTLTRA